MAKRASRESVERLGEFLRRNAALSEQDIQVAAENFAHGRTQKSSRTLDLAGDVTVPVPEGALVAADLPPDKVRARLTQLTDHVAAQVTAGELPRLDLPDLHRANALYDAGGNVFLGCNVRPLAFNRQGGEAFIRLLLALETASDNLRNEVHTTKRGLFYQHRAKLPDDVDQIDTDRAIASLANVLRVRRRALGFVEAPKGAVHGRLVIRQGSQVIDVAQMGPGGFSIPRFTDDVEIVSSDATSIVILEKGSTVQRLSEAKWWNTAHCIMVHGGGFPSMSAREFVRKLIDTLGIHAVILVDADPAGILCALNYAHGSISTALETPWLACGDLWWAGLLPSDIQRLSENSVMRLEDTELEAARRLLDHPSHAFVNDRVRGELSILLDRGVKAELEALSADASSLETYVLQKLSDPDLIKL